MRFDLLELFVLYPFLLAGIIMTWRMKYCQSALSLLVFSSIFVSFLKYTKDVVALISILMIVVLSSYLFYMEYERPPGKSKKIEDDRSVGDVIIEYLLIWGIVFLFKYKGMGWCFSLLMGYWIFYLISITAHRENRRAFYFLKVPYVVLSWGALVEEFGFQRELIPFLIAYLVVFVLWLKFDLPRMLRPLRIT